MVLQDAVTKPHTVLIVDDEPLVRWSVAETLTDSGYRVTSAGDAVDAMRVMMGSGERPDVVLLDLDLPDSKDLGVLSAMRQASPASSVIVITAHGSQELFDDARKRGAFASVDKPFEMSSLAPLVARALASQDDTTPVY